LARLQEASLGARTSLERDGCIQRFELPSSLRGRRSPLPWRKKEWMHRRPVAHFRRRGGSAGSRMTRNIWPSSRIGI